MKQKFKLPTVEEVKRVYHLAPDQKIEVREAESLPDPSELRSIGGVLREAAAYCGVPTFLLSAGGIVVAVLFFPYWGPKVKEEIMSAVTVTHDYWLGPFKSLPKPTEAPNEPRYAIVTTNANTVSQIITIHSTGHCPPGTEIHPL